MAHLSNDPGLLQAFENNLDVHKATAAEIFNIPFEKVTTEQRRSAKAINFGLIYGMSSFGLAQQLGTTRQLAQAYMDCYFSRYPGVKAYMENTRLIAKEKGYVETICGRRLYLPEINARQINRQRAAERAAINAPLQGTAADIIKIAMISISKALAEQQWDASMIMQVHDELVFEVAKDHCNNVAQLINHYMANAVSLKVPLIVDIGIGNNWDEAH
ncbi:MAG: DNA polymerase I [Legionellaceae bacterium]